MKIESAINLNKNNSTICYLLETLNISHHNEQVGKLLVLAVAENLSQATTTQMRFYYDAEVNSELDMERFRVESHLNINLSKFDDLEAIKKHVMIKVQSKLIGEAVSCERSNEEVIKAFSAWKTSPSEPFELEAPDSFNVIDVSVDVANLISSTIEKYFNLVAQDQKISV